MAGTVTTPDRITGGSTTADEVEKLADEMQDALSAPGLSMFERMACALELGAQIQRTAARWLRTQDRSVR